MKLFILILFGILLSSCSVYFGDNDMLYDNTFVIADKKLYRGFDAMVAYDLYNEVYNDSNYRFKPIVFKTR